jgi:transposase
MMLSRHGQAAQRVRSRSVGMSPATKERAMGGFGTVRRQAVSGSAWQKTVPKQDVRTGIPGMLYVLKTGYPWRRLPKDFSPWKTV